VRQQLGVDQPDFGVLFDGMEFLDGDELPADRLIQPKVEAEVAFVVGRDLGAGAPSDGAGAHRRPRERELPHGLSSRTIQGEPND
jgi:hypothetical protein